jgi:hypothetical protein
MRIFRGGNPKGGIIFYKDNVYLTGFLKVIHYLKQIMRNGELYGEGLLLCGKLSIEDIPLLKPYVNLGLVMPPTYLPHWAEQPGALAAHLVCNDLTEGIQPSKQHNH